MAIGITKVMVTVLLMILNTKLYLHAKRLNRPYAYSTVAVSSPETCDSSTALAHNGNSVSLKDDDFIKSAMRAVDRALCSFNKETSRIHRERGNKVEAGSGDAVQGKTSETDLSAVLIGWFSAGFYTGK
nr:hypothetical protein [Tanacetum cinerariifolium]